MITSRQELLELDERAWNEEEGSATYVAMDSLEGIEIQDVTISKYLYEQMGKPYSILVKVVVGTHEA